MKERLRFLGLDVHAETIAVAVAEPDGEVRSLGTIANREESIRKFIRKLGPAEQLRACYEAGPTGFVLYWQLAQLGVECAVVAPTLVPKKAGDRVKTDRRDALKLARSHRSGDLTAVWVPDEASEALRDLVRAREAAKQDQLRAQHRLTKFLLRTGRRSPVGVKAWTERYLAWLQQIHYTQPAQDATLLDCLNEVQHMEERIKRLEVAIMDAVKLAPLPVQEVIRGLQTLRGVAQISAVTIAAELGNISSHLLPLRERASADGLQRNDSQRRFQWHAQTARKHHQDRQRTPATNRGRIGLELSTPAIDRSSIAQATGRGFSRDHRDCLESAEPPTPPLYEADGCRQGPEEDHNGDRTRTHWFYLGHRNQSRSCSLQATSGGMTKTEKTKPKAFQ
jgi:transposase